MTGSNHNFQDAKKARQEAENKGQQALQGTELTPIGAEGFYFTTALQREEQEQENRRCEEMKAAHNRGQSDMNRGVDLARTLGAHAHNPLIDVGAPIARQTFMQFIEPAPASPFIDQIGRTAGNIANITLVEALHGYQHEMPPIVVLPSLGLAAGCTLVEAIARGGNNLRFRFNGAIEPIFFNLVRGGAQMLANQIVIQGTPLLPLAQGPHNQFTTSSSFLEAAFGELARRGEEGDAYRMGFFNNGMANSLFQYAGVPEILGGFVQVGINLGGRYVQFVTNNVLDVADMVVDGVRNACIDRVATGVTSVCIRTSTHFIESKLGVNHAAVMNAPAASETRRLVATAVDQGGQVLVLSTASSLTVRQIHNDLSIGANPTGAVVHFVEGVAAGTALNLGSRLFARQIHGSQAVPAAGRGPAAAAPACVLL